MQAGDRLIINTPGAGGYGPPESEASQDVDHTQTVVSTMHNAVPDAVDAAAVRKQLAQGDGILASTHVQHQPKGSLAEYKRLQESA